MQLSEQLLNDCEDFFELIENSEGDVKLDRAIDSLRAFLEREVDGWTQSTDQMIARAVQCRLIEIWGLVPKSEKAQESDLKEHYDNLVCSLEDVSDYETDEEEA